MNMSVSSILETFETYLLESENRHSLIEKSFQIQLKNNDSNINTNVNNELNSTFFLNSC